MTSDDKRTPGQQFDLKLLAHFHGLRQQAISRRGLFRFAAGAAGAAAMTAAMEQLAAAGPRPFLPGLTLLAQEGRTLTYALEGDVRGLEPALAYDFTANPVACQISEGLLMFDTNGGVQPLLAESVDHPDPATYIVKLKQGLTFQDGSPVTIDDVIASIARVRDPDVAGPLAWMYDNPKATVARTDDQTITITLGVPSSLFQFVLATTAGHVIPKAAIEKYGPDLLRNPIGTGPYKFVKWDSGSEIVLEKNPNYWQAGMPYFDQLVFKIVPEGTTRITGLKNGDVNMMEAVPPDQIATVKSFPNVDWHEVVGYTINYLALRNDKPPLNDVKVRKAISQAIDLNGIMTNIVKDEGILSHNTSVPPNMPGSATDQLQPPTYDVAAAQQLLAQSSQPNGFKTQLHTIAPNDIYVPQALAVQQSLKALNIDVEVKQYAYADYITMLQGGDYEGMLILQWGADFPDALANLLPMFLSTNVPPQNNASYYNNPQVDQLLNSADQELDPEKRKQMLIDAQKLISDDQPFVWFEHFKWFMPMTKGITGYSVTPLWYYDCWGRTLKPAPA